MTPDPNEIPDDDIGPACWESNWVEDDRPDWERAYGPDDPLIWPDDDGTDPWDRFDPVVHRCATCSNVIHAYRRQDRDDECYGCWLRRNGVFCKRCDYNYANREDYDDGLCDPCRDARLCSICRVKPRVSGHRCNTCRMYYSRNGVERPAELASRQGALNLRRPLMPGERFKTPEVEQAEAAMPPVAHNADPANLRALYPHT